MIPRHTEQSEWSVLASIARADEWPDGISADMFGAPAARRLYSWMSAARQRFGLWSPFAVGSLMERAGVDADTVDAAVDLLAETAPIYGTETLRTVIGLLVEQYAQREGLSASALALAKHRAGCELTESDIEALREANA